MNALTLDPPRQRGLGARRFASMALPRSERVAAWERHNSDSLVALRAASPKNTEFMAAGVNLSLPELDIARVRCSPHKVERTETEISAHPVNGAVAYLNLSKRGTFWHRGQTYELRPWQLLIVDGDQGFAREFELGTDEYVLRISRDLLATATQQRNLSTPRIFDADQASAEGGIVRSLRSLAATALTGPRQDWEGLQSTAATLICSLLGAGAPTQLQAARRLIAENYADPAYGAEGLARGIGVSTRQLSRIFAEHECSLAQELLRVRLEAARRRLAQPQLRNEPIADVATACGFASQAHFARRFRAEYGMPPLAYRKQGLSS